MSALSEAWSELLAEVAVRAPHSYELVRPGDADGPAEIERDLAVVLSSEVREWFALHSGVGRSWGGELLPGRLIMSPAEAVRTSRMIYEIWSEFSETADFAEQNPGVAGDVAYTWLREYVMVGDDMCGGGLFVDTRSGPLQGCVRQWDKTEADDDYGNGPVARSLAALLESALASVREGSPTVYGLVAEMTDGKISWRES
jgi:cell wall assembly regulator SMI1